MAESNINGFISDMYKFKGQNQRVFTVTQSLDQVKKAYASNNKLRLSFSSPARRGMGVRT